MGADQIAAIRPAIAELEAAARNSAGEFVARFEIPGSHPLWVEVVLGTVNVAYPWVDDPRERLLRQGISPLPKMTLTEWQPKLFATFLYELGTPSREVARFVDRVLGEMLGGAADYEVDVAIDRIAN